jgi:hypothetical protein
MDSISFSLCLVIGAMLIYAGSISYEEISEERKRCPVDKIVGWVLKLAGLSLILLTVSRITGIL